MANEEHLERLRQGVEAWNAWRREDLTIQPDLRGADLFRAHLTGINLDRAYLTGAGLAETHLARANLRGAYLARADLTGADLVEAELNSADLIEAHLTRADLRGANLAGANLTRAHLAEADLTEASIWQTIFANVDLNTVQGLETLKHYGPSTIDIDTLYRSQGNIPEVFLRGAGVPDDMITYVKTLVGRPFEFYSCFISYSSKDKDFAERLYTDLQDRRVRCWFAPEDLKIGEKIRTGIDKAIRSRDKLLLVLSENSVTSTWVEKEVETAFDEERQRKKTVLFPIRLDDAVMETTQAWAADIRLTRHIGDFRKWPDDDSYQKALTRLLHDLKAEI